MLTFQQSLDSASMVCHSGSEAIHDVSGILSECRVAVTLSPGGICSAGKVTARGLMELPLPPLLTAYISPGSSHSNTRP